jgi:hypothetical protein
MPVVMVVVNWAVVLDMAVMAKMVVMVVVTLVNNMAMSKVISVGAWGCARMSVVRHRQSGLGWTAVIRRRRPNP